MGFAGTKAEAEEIKEQLAGFLRAELKLPLSTEKAVTTRARTHKARFLGYDIWTRPPPWVQAMRTSRRKTLIVCTHCHKDHPPAVEHASLESRVRGNSHARFGERAGETD